MRPKSQRLQLDHDRKLIGVEPTEAGGPVAHRYRPGAQPETIREQPVLSAGVDDDRGRHVSGRAVLFADRDARRAVTFSDRLLDESADQGSQRELVP